MNPTWTGDAPPPPRRLGAGDWWRVLRRGVPVALVTFGGLGLHLVLRGIERPLHGARRPWTPHVTRTVCRVNLRLLGIETQHLGAPAPVPAVLVANHSSWLDIFALNAGQTLVFVSKAEVARWPGIGWLARATGTVFIRRDAREAGAQVAVLRARSGQGERLVLFPEGTSSDGRRVLPFKPALFAAFAGDAVPGLVVQPVTIRWQAPEGEDARFYGWWGDMALGPHLLRVLAEPRQGRLQVIRHAAFAPSAGRKEIAAEAEAAVRAGFSRP
ncbi:MAG: 1-acyl-sn-glycerol-3-phosphate acyltransferase [Rubellimicrobium sp.]|nr:1-acyl-sn-glycerol-3-phosphate acyltransferase [Rubellimicrobium sp.]